MNLDYLKGSEIDRKYVCGAMRRYTELAPFKVNHVKVDYKTNIKIKQRNYFSDFALQKRMHYFRPGTNSLYFQDMKQLANQRFETVEDAFNMEHVEFKQDNRKFCEQLKSIADNSGRIFLSNAYEISNKFYEVFQDTFEGGLLKPCDSKNYLTQDNSLISFNNDIYSIGGRVL